MIQAASLGFRTQAFQSTQRGPRHTVCVPVGRQCRATRTSVLVHASKEPAEVWGKVIGAVVAAQLVILPFAAPGPSYAALDTATEKKGVSATIEGSDIQGEDQKAVLDKLKNKILPEAKKMLGKVGSSEGGNYPSSAAKELETVSTEVEGLIKQANEGGDMSNIKSSASGIEQQINALKAIVGFD